MPGMRFAAIVGALAACLVAGSAVSAQSTPVLHDLRVCGATKFSRELQECTSDESASALTSNRVTCSAEVDLDGPAMLERSMTYNGASIPFDPDELEEGSYPIWINENLKIDRPLPGGSWTCALAVADTKVTASFTMNGPTGEVVNTAACRYSSTVRYGSGRVCKRDESASAIPATNAVACYATYPSASGQLARLTIVRSGRVIQSTSIRFRTPMTWAWVWTKAASGLKLPGGRYACRYWLDGKLIASKPFTLDG